MKQQDVTVVRIYCSEKGGRYRELMSRLHDEEQVAGVTAFRGIAGFGGSGRVHEVHLLDVSLDLPIVIEFFDRPERVEKILSDLRDMIPPGHAISWPARANLE
ncbi:MAG: DUF190 domain-containing protein [Gammaproteobacteria bacterium]|nr:MAG: DUF190 domain-containing protein [Gammaproteobacteria bacterium]